jgi:type II secretory pathway component PulC
LADNKKKIELTITGISVIILIFLIMNHISKPKANKSMPNIEPYSTSESGFEITNNEQRTTNDERWGRDPFLLDASNVKEQGMEDLVLNGIVSDRDNPYAIINNDVVKLGNKVNGMTIIEINEKNVVLEQDGQKHTLELNPY